MGFMLNKKIRVAVVGEGISALALLERLGQDEKLCSQVELLWFAAPHKAPGCSMHSTALITDHGINPDFGGLAPDLLQALELAFKWPFLKQAPGVYWTQHWALDEGSDSFARRYGTGHPLREHRLFKRPLHCREAPAVIIDVRSFIPALKKRVEKLWSCQSSCELVLDYNGQTLVTEQAKWAVDLVFWCSGAGVVRPQSFSVHPKAARLKRVEGYAYQYQLPEWDKEVFAMTVGHVNLISRGGEVFLGGTTQNEGARIPDAHHLAAQFQKLEQAGLDLSALKNKTPHFWGGPRQKGQKKKFLIGALNQREFGLLGTYKNGYSLCQLGAARAHSWLWEKLY